MNYDIVYDNLFATVKIILFYYSLYTCCSILKFFCSTNLTLLSVPLYLPMHINNIILHIFIGILDYYYNTCQVHVAYISRSIADETAQKKTILANALLILIEKH